MFRKVNRFSMLCFLSMSLLGLVVGGAFAENPVVTKNHTFRSFDGNKIYVKEKYIPANKFDSIVVCFPPCIYSHHFFDCPLSDYSIMDHLAKKGFRIFAYDPRGFGLSDRPTDGRSITYEVELKDAKALFSFVLAKTGAKRVSVVAFGSGAQIACGHAIRHPEEVHSLALMDFVWKVFPEPLPTGFKEMLLSQPNGYLRISLVKDLFNQLLRFATPEMKTWISTTFTEAPVGPFLTSFDPMPLINPVKQFQSSVMIIRGTEAGITSETDSFDFLSNMSGSIRAMNVLEGAGPVPSLEKNHYQTVMRDIAWFLSK